MRPIELATAAVLGGVSAALVVIGAFFPHATAVAALAAVPLGVVAHRHRFRALIAATVAAAVVGFLAAGTGPLYGVFMCALVGGLAGTGKRRGWSRWRTMAGALVSAPVIAGLAVGSLALFASLRKLTLDQVRHTWHGAAKLLGRLPGFHGIAATLDHWVATAVRDWWATIAVIVAVGVLGSAWLAWELLGAVLERLSWLRAEDRLDLAGTDDMPTGPLPAVLAGVGYRYPGATVDALVDVSMEVDAGQYVTVVGANGSGKSTLARILAGRPATAGVVDRPGSAALGQPQGTALIMQRPESQILGVRVADDVVWGLPTDQAVDISALLNSVGLAGMEDRDTSTLSGGELQRLAVASALARRPRVLISDESTAMVDPEGRQRLTALLAALPSRHGTAVVHVTHRLEETAASDRTIHLAAGRVVAPPPPPPGDGVVLNGHVSSPAVGRDVLTGGSFSGAARLRAVGVSHTYAAASPWAQPALFDVDLTIGDGAGVLVVGGNGSGKSTLAWILAGLIIPTEGECLLGGRPASQQVGAVGLAFQHARLQLQRPTVRADIHAASGVNPDQADAALVAVGLDPAELGERHVDELSGGQQRRVALAGLLARQPQVLIVDEPLAGLDEGSREAVIRLLTTLRRERGLTVIAVSHDIDGMERVCDRIVHLDAGRLVADEPWAPESCR